MRESACVRSTVSEHLGKQLHSSAPGRIGYAISAQNGARTEFGKLAVGGSASMPARKGHGCAPVFQAQAVIEARRFQPVGRAEIVNR